MNNQIFKALDTLMCSLSSTLEAQSKRRDLAQRDDAKPKESSPILETCLSEKNDATDAGQSEKEWIS